MVDGSMGIRPPAARILSDSRREIGLLIGIIFFVRVGSILFFDFDDMN